MEWSPRTEWTDVDGPFAVDSHGVTKLFILCLVYYKLFKKFFTVYINLKDQIKNIN